MLELDLMLQGFIDSDYASLDKEEQELFVKLLDLPDQELFEQLMEVKGSERKEFSHVITKIRHATTSQY